MALCVRLIHRTGAQPARGVDGKAVAKQLLTEHNIEIGGGLGELAGKVWRVGLMGYNSRQDSVDRLIMALQQVLK